MNKAMAMPGNMADSFPVYFFGIQVGASLPDERVFREHAAVLHDSFDNFGMSLVSI